jgi:hypothetical protein
MLLIPTVPEKAGRGLVYLSVGRNRPARLLLTAVDLVRVERLFWPPLLSLVTILVQARQSGKRRENSHPGGIGISGDTSAIRLHKTAGLTREAMMEMQRRVHRERSAAGTTAIAGSRTQTTVRGIRR